MYEATFFFEEEDYPRLYNEPAVLKVQRSEASFLPAPVMCWNKRQLSRKKRDDAKSLVLEKILWQRHKVKHVLSSHKGTGVNVSTLHMDLIWGKWFVKMAVSLAMHHQQQFNNLQGSGAKIKITRAIWIYYVCLYACHND